MSTSTNYRKGKYDVLGPDNEKVGTINNSKFIRDRMKKEKHVIYGDEIFSFIFDGDGFEIGHRLIAKIDEKGVARSLEDNKVIFTILPVNEQ